jgi:hypothetical protein
MGLLNLFKKSQPSGENSQTNASQVDPFIIMPSQPPSASDLNKVYLANPASPEPPIGVTLPGSGPNDSPNTSPLSAPFDVPNKPKT